MLLSSKGEIIDAIQVPDGMALFEYFKVLVYVGQGKDRECVGEEDFKEFPTDEQILWAVLHNKGSYAEVTLIHAPHELLSFSEDCDGNCENCECEDDLPF